MRQNMSAENRRFILKQYKKGYSKAFFSRNIWIWRLENLKKLKFHMTSQGFKLTYLYRFGLNWVLLLKNLKNTG